MKRMRIPSLLVAGLVGLLLPTESFANLDAQFQRRCDKAWGQSEASSKCRNVTVKYDHIDNNQQLICSVSAFCKANGKWTAVFPDRWKGRNWEMKDLDFCEHGSSRRFVVNPPRRCW